MRTTSNSFAANPSITPREILSAWGRILTGNVPMLSIEITRECPLSCPGCYAYGDAHLGGGVTLEKLSDFRGDSLVSGVLDLVRKHKPLHVSLVGGEPMVRHRELSRILPALSAMNVFALVVTSGVIPVPIEWMKLPRVRVAISVDGLPEHHDIRRKPATYDRLLKNIEGREVNIHWTITRPMLERDSYLEEYVSFWNARPEVNRIWVSVYTPQVGEQTPEMLSPEHRLTLAERLPALAGQYPKLLFNKGIAGALVRPPKNPADCVFSKMSANYTADLETRVEPCVFGGAPDCSQCGCAASSGLHWIRGVRAVGPLKVGHFIESSVRIGLLANRLRRREAKPSRWDSDHIQPTSENDLVQIGSGD
ncbi:MAG TPA: radical SAM protein [Candidatus Acidoferrales bacterium]|nr:radical SAM protein [Candidatus Acidoferrales bacterium]